VRSAFFWDLTQQGLVILYQFFETTYQSHHKEEKINTYRVVVQKPEGKISLGRHKCRWEDNIEMDLKARGLEGKE
jgi:hypothetical protein